jgi:hypothetical protein
MFKLPEGFALPEGVNVEDLIPDPGKRAGHYLDTRSNTVFFLGVNLERAEKQPAVKKGGA